MACTSRMQTFSASFTVHRVAIWLEFGVLTAHANVHACGGQVVHAREQGHVVMSESFHLGVVRKLLFRSFSREEEGSLALRSSTTGNFIAESEIRRSKGLRSLKNTNELKRRRGMVAAFKQRSLSVVARRYPCRGINRCLRNRTASLSTLFVFFKFLRHSDLRQSDKSACFTPCLVQIVARFRGFFMQISIFMNTSRILNASLNEKLMKNHTNRE